MNINIADKIPSQTIFRQLKIDPESNKILKPIRKQLNNIAQGHDVTISKFVKEYGNYKDYGLVIDIARENLKSKNVIKNLFYKLTHAHHPAISYKIAQKCIMNNNGSNEILFEAEDDLIRSRTYKYLKNAINEHSVVKNPVLRKIQSYFKVFT